MIRDLRYKEAHGTPEERAWAHEVLNELFRKWVTGVRKDYKQRFLEHELPKEKKMQDVIKEGMKKE